MKKLKIAQVAPLWYRVPPVKYGGIELIVFYLTQELVKRGHEVTLFASGDSKTSARLFSVYPNYLRKDDIRRENTLYNLLNLSEALKRQKEFDIIHSHINVLDLFFSPFLEKNNFISTLHYNLKFTKEDYKKNAKGSFEYIRTRIFKHFKNHKFISISKSQQKLSSVGLNFIGNVYNGIGLDDFKFNKKGSDEFIWIAKMERTKGIIGALKTAIKMGKKLKIAGRINFEQEKKLFYEEIDPHLKKDQITYVGEVSQKEKSKFFGQAKALLYPIEWDEPFGLVMIEAMACGTPVIAFDRGSVREIVKDEKTGFVVKDLEGMKKAINKVDQIDRKKCREHIEKNFSASKMAENYENIYYEILSKK